MQNTFYIRLGSAPETGVSWLDYSADGVPRESSGELRETALRAQGARVVVLAPASPMLTCVAELPPTPAARLRQALPYALEEQFAEDVERLHFAMGQRDSNGKLSVVAVEREVMSHWQALFAEAELRPHVMLNEGLALPWKEGEWSLLLQEDEALLRIGAAQAYAVPMAQAASWLTAALQAEGIFPSHVCIYDARLGEPDEVWQEVLPGIEISYESIDSPLSLLAKTEPSGSINLLQGDFSRKEQLGRLWRPWRATAALLGLWLLLQGSMAIGGYFSLSAKEDRLYAAIEQVYRDTFPEARNVVNPRVQMERQLAALQGGGNGGAFVFLLAASGPVLSEVEGLELRNLRYRQDELELELELKDLASLDRLREALEQQSLLVDIRGATTREDKVESRIALKEAGA
ncbi:MAG: type II secretion system protein GspL [Anaerolineae bacterium]|nr:type II secretion system protein GspL [Anaerolineae bacterium]